MTVQSTQNLMTGVITGQVVTDAELDGLTYTVRQAPHYGTLMVGAEGRYVYTPDGTAPANVRDTFVIEVDSAVGKTLQPFLATVTVDSDAPPPQTDLQSGPFDVLVNESIGADGYVLYTGGPDVGALAALASDPDFDPAEFIPPPAFLEIRNKIGQPVWVYALPPGQLAVNFRIQQFQGKPVLTWTQCTSLRSCTHYIADTAYNVIGQVSLQGKLSEDGHEFRLTPEGYALMIGSRHVQADLTGVGGPVDGEVLDTLAVVVDLLTNEILAQWDPIDMVPITDSYEHYNPRVAPPLLDGTYDAYHLNSVAQGPHGDLLISMRNTAAIYSVNPSTGEINWQLGGKNPTLAAGPGVDFAFQHAAEYIGPNRIRIFNNDNATSGTDNPSSVLTVEIDADANAATLVSTITHPDGIAAWAAGNAQTLPNGNVFGSWGTTHHLSEFTPDGQLVYDVTLPGLTYRAFIEPWRAEPQHDPQVTVSATGVPSLHAMWNGATEVHQWRLLSGTTADNLAELDTFGWAGWHTTVPLPAASQLAGYLQLEALDVHGAVIGRSAVIPL